VTQAGPRFLEAGQDPAQLSAGPNPEHPSPKSPQGLSEKGTSFQRSSPEHHHAPRPWGLMRHRAWRSHQSAARCFPQVGSADLWVSGDAPTSQACLPQLQGPGQLWRGQAQSKVVTFATVPALQPSPVRVGFRRSTKTRRQRCPGQELLRGKQAGRDSSFSWAPLTSAPWSGGTQEAPTMNAAPSHALQAKAPGTLCPSSNLITGPGPAQPDGRGADGLFKSFPFVLPQDTLKGKLLMSLFYFHQARASSTTQVRRGLC